MFIVRRHCNDGNPECWPHYSEFHTREAAESYATNQRWYVFSEVYSSDEPENILLTRWGSMGPDCSTMRLAAA